MAYPRYLRDKARALRSERGLTLDEIAERLALPRTTVYSWIRDLPLGRPPRVAAAARRGNLAMQAKYQRLREAAYQQGWAEYDQLIAVPTFRDFVVLYIAEGSKRDRNQVALGNSDPNVVALAARWLNRLSDHPIDYRVQFHADQDLAVLQTFWAERLSIEPDVVRFQRKSNSGQLSGRTWRSQHGVLTVRASDTLLRARLQAWIDRVREGWSLECDLTHGA